jgi:hypothetical protein
MMQLTKHLVPLKILLITFACLIKTWLAQWEQDLAMVQDTLAQRQEIQLHASSKPFSMAPRLEADAMADSARSNPTLTDVEREQLYELA